MKQAGSPLCAGQHRGSNTCDRIVNAGLVVDRKIDNVIRPATRVARIVGVRAHGAPIDLELFVKNASGYAVQVHC